MKSFEEIINNTIVGELIATLEKRNLPIIHEKANIRKIVDTMISFEHSRLLYVVDDDKRLTGVISLGALSRHIFSPSHEPQIHPRFLINMITAETAKDIVQKNTLFTTEKEKVEVALKKMIKRNVKEIPVLDNEKRVIADFTIMDLLRFMVSSEEYQKTRMS